MRRLVTCLVLVGLPVLGCARSEPASSPAANGTTLAGSAGAETAHVAPPESLAGWARGAQLFANLGTFHRGVTAAWPEAQQYFDQGMRLLWAFNHDESTRSFAKAATVDPSCALCFWGVALTVGPNYNMPMMAEARARVAWEALQQAQRVAAHATPVEQALVAALGKRYTGPQPLDPSSARPALTAYASAMRDVARAFPDDMDVRVLSAEALMNANPWKLWTPEGQPAPGTIEIETMLESVLERDPSHPGANHYYMHTMEASPHPERALAAAERVRGMMPGAGHLQHMPAHIFQRVGRYEDASQANRDGVIADTAYLAATTPPDYYSMYVAHNYQFLAYSAAMEGRRAETIDAANAMRHTMPVELLVAMPGTDWYVSEVYSALLRFGLWDEMLAEPAPDARLTALTGAYHYARAIALAAKGRVDDATVELGRLDAIAAATPADAGAGLNSARDVLAVASLVARGQIARASGRTDDAVARLREAVAREDRLGYDEPSDWFLPVRHQLGAALLAAGMARDAEEIYREDLAQHPHNGWALFGLAQALRAQHRNQDAADVDREFAAAWSHADATLKSSVF
jgi:tetratricopeptide (TPR) repeat protein